MRRLIASSFVVLAITVVLATPSLAANTAPVLQKPLTDVPFSGTSNFAFSSHSCSFVFETYDLTFEMRHSRTGTIHIEGCVNSSGAFPGGFGFESGTFTLSTGGHGKDSTLQGTVSGSIFPPNLTLTSTSDVKGPHASGVTIAVVGTGGPSGPVSGTLTTAT